MHTVYDFTRYDIKTHCGKCEGSTQFSSNQLASYGKIPNKTLKTTPLHWNTVIIRNSGEHLTRHLL